MIKVAIDKNDWYDYKESAWGGAISTLNDVEEQDREEEAIEIIEEYMSEDVFGYISSETEVNAFIWFSLPDIMHLYDEDDGEDDEDDNNDEDYEEEE